MDALIGYVLLGGVVVSVVLIVAGLVWHWVNTGHLGVQYTIPKMNLFEFVDRGDSRSCSAASSVRDSW